MAWERKNLTIRHKWVSTSDKLICKMLSTSSDKPYEIMRELRHNPGAIHNVMHFEIRYLDCEE